MKIERPYEGLVVVEAAAGPLGSALRLSTAMTGRILADLGARVIRIIGDDEQQQARQPYWGAENDAVERFLSAGKSTMWGNPGDREFVSRLLRRADIAIVDRHVHRLIAADDLPANVAVLSLFGGRHADAEIPATEFTISALGGLLNMVGDPDRKPLKLGGHQEAYALGLSAFCGLAALLADRRRALPTMTVRANLLDVVVWLNWKSAPLEAGAPVPPGRAGAAAEWQVLRCADGWIALVYQEPDWPHLCDMVGDDRLRQAKFATRQGRLGNLAELADIIETVFLSRTRRQLHEQAASHRLPLGPVWSPDELIDDPHNLARAMFTALPPLPGEQAPVQAPRLPVLWNGLVLSSSAGHAPARAVAGLS
ncbi:CoA transferase [Nitratireductor soli]|uniref:CoA transferase n=1 Tax=Nitratireductor soli TaxID=1670619 RepID=UPI00065E0EF4|nr:CoA transferase [Nitratireductor soli]